MNATMKKITLGLAAATVAAMTFAGAAQAKPKVHLHLSFGAYGPAFGIASHYPGYGWAGPCKWYLKKYKKTGKYYWKKKFKKCMYYNYY